MLSLVMGAGASSSLRRISASSKSPRISVAQMTTMVNRLTVLSWNLAGRFPSRLSPDDFDTTAALSSQVDCIQQHEPDVLLLQEWANSNLPQGDIRHALMDAHNLVGTTKSHCEYVHLWVKKNIEYDRIALPEEQPSVAATMAVGTQRIGIASSHFAPYKDNASVRLDQVTQLAGHLPPVAIMGGDYNMRNAESESVEGLHLLDTWKLAGSDKRHEFTWNSLVNKFHGEESYGFKVRFDRIYVRGDPLKVTSFELIGTEPMERDKLQWYLSDHYGILVKILVDDTQN